MESAVLESPPATADAEAEARADLLGILKTCTHFGGVPVIAPGRHTWSACCGSLILDREGCVGNSTLNTFVGPAQKDIEHFYEKQYGERWKERLWPSGRYNYYPEPNTLEELLIKNTRRNTTGVIFAHMDKDKAIEIMYDEKHRELAEGYNIDDKDQGYVCSVIWLNK